MMFEIRYRSRLSALIFIGALFFLPSAPEAAMPRRANLMQNGDFEFGVDHWTSSNGVIAQAWRFDPASHVHGFGSLCTAYLDVWRKFTLRSYPIPVANGGEYVFTASMKAAKKGARMAIEIRGTGAPWSVNQEGKKNKSVTVARQTVTLGQDWRRVEVRVRVPRPYPYPAVMVDFGVESSQGKIWIDDCFFGTAPRPAAPESCELSGVEFISPSFGNIFKPNASAAFEVRGVNCAAVPVTLNLETRVEDDFEHVTTGKRLQFNLAPQARGEWRKVQLDTSRRGHYKLTASVSDSRGRLLSTQTLHYAVFTPVDGGGYDDESFFGIVTHWGFDSYWNNAPTYSGNYLALLRQLGIRWVRDWIPWNAIEKKPGEFDWAPYDAMVKGYKDHHLRLVTTITRYYAPEHHWQGGPRFSIPGDQAIFKKSFTEIVRRYRDDVWGWEIWNEPAYDAEADLYAATVRTAWDAVKAVDPKIKILAPSLVGTRDAAKMEPWIRTVFEKAKDQIDVISTHGYHRILEWYEPQNPLAKVLNELGLAGRYPVWNTEWGVRSTSEWFADRSDHEILLTNVRTYLKCISAGQAKYFWFVAAPASWDGFSVFYDRFVPRPNMIAQAWMAALLDQAKPAGHHAENDLEVHRYATAGGVVAAIWFSGAVKSALDLATLKRIAGADAECFDVYGNPLTGRLVISPLPIYLKGRAFPEARQLYERIYPLARAALKAGAENALGEATLLTTDLPNLTTNPSGPAHPVSPDGFIRDWRLFGPFANPAGKGFERDLLKGLIGDEAAAVIPQDLIVAYQYPRDPGGLYGYPRQRVTLRPIAVHEAGDRIDLLTRCTPKDNVVIYAACWIVADRQLKAKIKIGSDDGNKVWLNHVLFGGKRAERPCRPDDDVYDCVLNKGANYLLLKIEQTSGGWSFMARLTDERDNPLGVSIKR